LAFSTGFTKAWAPVEDREKAGAERDRSSLSPSPRRHTRD